MNQNAAEPRAWLGVDGGGTRSVAVYECGSIRRRVEAGPGNLRLLSDAQLLSLFQSIRAIHEGLPSPEMVTIGMASARIEMDRQRIRRFAGKVWPGSPCIATDDLEPALAAAEREHGRAAAGKHSALVVALAGTGSCFFGRNDSGKRARIGGWGHILGDKGSAYEIGLRALKTTLYYYDRDGALPSLGRRIMRRLLFNGLDEISAWVFTAPKSEVADLSREVFAAASRGDKVARDILEGAAQSIAEDAATCAGHLTKKAARVKFVFSGSVLLKQRTFAKRVATLLRERWPNSEVVPLTFEAALGAVEIAKNALNSVPEVIPKATASSLSPVRPRGRPGDSISGDWFEDPRLANSPTEERHPRSMHLDTFSVRKAISLILEEDREIPAAILAERPRLERAIQRIVRSFKIGGRLFYAGAGTSGRLGVLDASECPPTFRTDPEMVQGIIAGGQTALWLAVEGAEDDSEAGLEAMRARGVDRKDVVVGIAASGRTPFVWGALREAKRRGAVTILLCFNPELRIPREDRPEIVIAPRIGPEILTGSTRLKAGTATKLILNVFTTVSMVRLGKVVGNLMVDLKPTNRKLRQRAIRIVMTLTDSAEERARAALERSGWNVKKALARLRRG